MKYGTTQRALASSILASLVLAACGGGGGGDTASTNSQSNVVAAATTTPTPTPAPSASSKISGIFISEIANHQYFNQPAWFEIFNNSGQAIDLANYSLRAHAQNPSTGTPAAGNGLSVFPLPHLTVANGDRIVVAGKTSAGLNNGNHVIYINDTNGYVPAWTSAGGFVELLYGNTTIDFVHFGIDTNTPITPSAWTGAAVPAMAAGNLNTSIVRLDARFTQTHSAADWTAVDFATPGGPNDVPAGVVDSDNDGIPDTAKEPGSTFNGIDLYSMGARHGQRDLFVQVDYLDASAPNNDPGIMLQKQALDNVVAAFLPHNIHLHFDAGNLFTSTVSATDYNLSGNVSHQHPFVKCLDNNPSQPGTASAGCTDIYTVKSTTFDYRRSSVFRYMLMGSSQLASGLGGSSGVAEITGPNFLITLGGWHLSTSTQANMNTLVNYQAGTIMHEMGHTLGLLHGGDENTNDKPNYLSIMNYMYQLYGLPDATGATPGGATISEVNERYYEYQYEQQTTLASPSFIPGLADSVYAPQNMHDGPATTTFRLDYSNGSSAQLNESALDESQVLGRPKVGGAFIDWDMNLALTATSLQKHIVDGGANPSYTSMHDYNDWANLILAFARYPTGHYAGVSQISATSSTQTAPYDPVTNPRKPTVVEDAPPAFVLWRRNQ